MIEFSPSNEIENIHCICVRPPLSYMNFIVCYLGMDCNHGRYGAVSIRKCIHCNRKWIFYEMEDESISASGRWYTGIIEKKNFYWIRDYNAWSYLKEIPWYIYGGSYYNSAGKLCQSGIN
jgi:hypothetical protein